MRIALILFIFFIIPPFSSSAHGVKLFAVNNDGHISGQGYFVGGGPAVNCRIILQNQAGQEVSQTRTDEKGKFTLALPADVSGPHLLLLNAGPGHAARVNFDFKAADADDAALAMDKSDAIDTMGPDNLPASFQAPDSQLLLAQINHQLHNINQQLLALQILSEPGVTFEKIIAGLGYIMGLLGAAMYFHYRPRPIRGNDYVNEK
jgi:nickel transport protein